MASAYQLQSKNTDWYGLFKITIEQCHVQALLNSNIGICIFQLMYVKLVDIFHCLH